MSTTKTTGKGEVRVPWGKISEQLEATLAAHGVTDESIRRTVQEHEARMAAGLPRRVVVSGVEMFRDHGHREDEYTVGYGGERNYARPAAPARDFTPTDKQIKFLDDLLRDREHTYTEAQIAEGRADWRKIRPMIDELKVSAKRQWQDHDLARAPQVEAVETPVPAAPSTGRMDWKAVLAAVPDGNYAIFEGDEADDVVKFYRVDTTKKGFKKVQIRASDELYPTKNFSQDMAILRKIMEFGIENSRMLFSRKLVRCYTCYRSLTDAVSRECGQGPECRSK